MSRVRALVFHHALGFVHQSIPNAVAAIVAMGQDHNFQVATTAEPRAFTTANLDRFDVVILVHTSGNVLSEPEPRVALERFVQTGGGVVAVHAAASMKTRAPTCTLSPPSMRPRTVRDSGQWAPIIRSCGRTISMAGAACTTRWATREPRGPIRHF